jgi:hypothetical protein
LLIGKRVEVVAGVKDMANMGNGNSRELFAKILEAANAKIQSSSVLVGKIFSVC